VISRGRYNNLYLYEITEQDLILKNERTAGYHAGNVLIFPDKETIALGYELARADDVATAREYLDAEYALGGSRAAPPAQHALAPRQASQAPAAVATPLAPSTPAAPPAQHALATPTTPAPPQEASYTAQAQLFESQIHDLQTRIEQRDGLLHELASDLKSQQETNELLLSQLASAQTQLEVDRISRDEMVDDLRNVSADIHTVETSLGRTIEEKLLLEQELAERITELLDLNLQNDDLKRQLKPHVQSASKPGPLTPAAAPNQAATAAPSGAPGTTGSPIAAPAESAPPAAAAAAAPAIAPSSDAQVVTLSSGKQVHIYHEFPPPPRPTAGTRAILTLGSIIRVALISILALILLLALSVVATAHLDNISLGEALDLLLKSLTSLVGYNP
jgi:hypothetical protein